MRYLKSTTSLCLVYGGEIDPSIGFTDSDWDGDRETRRSTSGYIFNLGSGAISWSSKRQSSTALSSCEAEYIGQTQATKEAVWLRRLLVELQVAEEEGHAPIATVIYGDNQGAIALTKNPEFHARTKHIDIQHHFAREKQQSGEVDLQYIPTEQQVADGLTKALPRDKLEAFRNALGLRKGPSAGNLGLPREQSRESIVVVFARRSFSIIVFFPVFPLHGQLAQQMRAFSDQKEEPGQSHYRKNTGRVAKVRLG